MKFTDYDTRIAAYAVIIDPQDRILLSWYNGRGRGEPGWTLPGGGVEYTETTESAVVREVLEETGYDVETGRLLPVHTLTLDSGPDPGRPYKSVRIVYEAQIRGGALGTLERDGTTDRAVWMPLAQVPLTNACADIVDIALEALHQSR